MTLPILLAFFAGVISGSVLMLFWCGRAPSEAEREAEDLITKVYDHEPTGDHVDDLRRAGGL